MEKNITLIGMMGAGKSSVAEYLAEMIDNFINIDTDSLVQIKFDMTINDIFAQKGEAIFRKAETEVIKMVYKNPNQVVALGGGAFENKENRDIIKSNSVVIYLKTSPDVLFSRLKNSHVRPLLTENFNIDKIKDIVTSREENYLQADFVVNTDNKSPYEVAKEISELLNGKYRY